MKDWEEKLFSLENKLKCLLSERNYLETKILGLDKALEKAKGKRKKDVRDELNIRKCELKEIDRVIMATREAIGGVKNELLSHVARAEPGKASRSRGIDSPFEEIFKVFEKEFESNKKLQADLEFKKALLMTLREIRDEIRSLKVRNVGR